MKFPILVFDRKLDLIILDYKFLMGDVRFVNQAFRNVEVVDSGTVELVQEKMNGCTSYKQLIEIFK